MDIVVGMLGNPASPDGVVAVHNADQKKDTNHEDLHMPSVGPPGAPNCDVRHAGRTGALPYNSVAPLADGRREEGGYTRSRAPAEYRCLTRALYSGAAAAHKPARKALLPPCHRAATASPHHGLTTSKRHQITGGSHG